MSRNPPRKTLALPPKEPGDQTLATRGRRPVRGGVAQRKSGSLAAPPLPMVSLPAVPQRAPSLNKAPRTLPVASKATIVPPHVSPSGVRISKLMAERGLCSRREADAYIERGWVFVDGQRINELGLRADPAAQITLASEARACQQRQMTILLNKPVGYVSAQPEPGFIPAVTLIQPETQWRTSHSPDSLNSPIFHASHLKGLAPAGRLDIDSTGLLVLTQDGRVARQLIGENSKVDKEYLVRVEGRLDAAGLALLNHGLRLDDKVLRPAKVEWLNEDQLRFVLREGRKRQIRRMCELVGIKVIGLKRVRIGGVKLGDLPLGQWRFLREDEGF
jgi:23S rRNA pseudouridine2604 synthase